MKFVFPPTPNASKLRQKPLLFVRLSFGGCSARQASIKDTLFRRVLMFNDTCKNMHFNSFLSYTIILILTKITSSRLSEPYYRPRMHVLICRVNSVPGISRSRTPICPEQRAVLRCARSPSVRDLFVICAGGGSFRGRRWPDFLLGWRHFMPAAS